MQNQPNLLKPQASSYRFFVLRVWRDTPNGQQQYMLKAADNRQQHIFADSQSLVEFLNQTTYQVDETR